MTQFSLIVPCYQSAALIAELVNRCISAGTALGRFELILVDDGSTDTTWNEIERYSALHSEVLGIRLGRNLGEHKALLAGFCVATGQNCLSLDDDLQHHPEEMGLLLGALQKGNDLIMAQYRRSSHGFIRRMGGLWNGWIATALHRRPIGLHLSSYKDMSRALFASMSGTISFCCCDCRTLGKCNFCRHRGCCTTIRAGLKSLDIPWGNLPDCTVRLFELVGAPDGWLPVGLA